MSSANVRSLLEPRGDLRDSEIRKLKEIEKIYHIETRKYPAPIYWLTDSSNAHTVLHNGTCFFIETPKRRFGITAHHVIKKFREDRAKHDRLYLMIRNTVITDWDKREISGDAGLDIVTFEVSDKEFEEIQAHPFKCKSEEKWPPLAPQTERGVFFTGYAGIDRKALNKSMVEFCQSSNASVLASPPGPEELEIRISKEDLYQMTENHQIPSLRKDLGGFSGAPLFVVSSGLVDLFWLGGVILKQIPAFNEEDSVTFIARRINCVKTDGTLITSRYVE